MNKRGTLNNLSTDLSELILYLLILILGICPGFQNSSTFSIAIILQVASNLKNFWHYIDKKFIKKKLKVTIVVLILLSAIVGILSILSLVEPAIVFDNLSYGVILKFVSLIIVSLPIILIGYDIILNLKFDRN